MNFKSIINEILFSKVYIFLNKYLCKAFNILYTSHFLKPSLFDQSSSHTHIVPFGIIPFIGRSFADIINPVEEDYHMRIALHFIVLYTELSYINKQTRPRKWRRLSADDDKHALKRHARKYARTHAGIRSSTCAFASARMYVCMRDLSDSPCVRSSPENISSIAHCVSGALVGLAPMLHSK